MRRRGVWCVPVLVVGLAAAVAGEAACVAIAEHPEGRTLARIAVSERGFTISYLHSVTRTPVDERYRVRGAEIVQEAIAFSEHGPGLPTVADADGRFEQRDGRMTMTMQRRMPSMVMRVHADQAPRLVANERALDLAAWGNRSLAVTPVAGACAGVSTND